ncbi:MAG: SpoIID/LytB domain-containing protein [Kofleriaceae bacterium]|nr:SpoIID/LytB domain-containing protein [Kofleriaceae bacterium]MCL4226509.1 SpoIID/LytB domain-containing protein [Myxococcales bacterium]
MAHLRPALAVALVAVVAAPARPAAADETSTADKLRILYSSRFTFTDDGLPLITVEVMSGQREVHLSAAGGLVILPDGDGGSATTVAGATAVTVTGESGAPADVREWTVVARLGPDDASGQAAALDAWRARGHDPQVFEVGSLFAVAGEVIDTREHLVAVAPVAAGKGAARARALAAEHKVATSVHRELARRPAGTIVARAGATTVRNPSVVWFRPARAGDTITVRDVPTGTGGSQLATGAEDRRYWGAIYVTFGSDGRLTAVNAVPEDRLLAGLVPAEIFPDAPEAALEAQAIAARTELLEKLGHRDLTEPYLLCSTQQCQVYAGAGKEHPRTTRAVERTRGVVMLRDGGGLIDARYSASAGGRTEDNDAIWGGAPDPSLRGRADTADRALAERFAVIDERNLEAFLAAPADKFWSGATRWGKRHFRWTVERPATELSAHVARVYPEVGAVTALEVVRRSPSGRVRALRIVGSRGKVTAEGDLHLRRLLGGLKSSLFAVTAVGPAGAPTAFVFRGAGFGHGVGMDQVGAIGMADAGRTHAQILAAYYRGMRLHRLY